MRVLETSCRIAAVGSSSVSGGRVPAEVGCAKDPFQALLGFCCAEWYPWSCLGLGNSAHSRKVFDRVAVGGFAPA